jgi:putative DNA primase/helicase
MTDTADHYARLGDLYAEFGRTGDSYCPGNRDFTGWYRTRLRSDSWDGKGRVWALGPEYNHLRDGLDRTLYATVNYAPNRWFADAWRPFEWDGDDRRTWRNDRNPTPGYGDLAAFAPFADIDLAEDAKHGRPDGDLDRDTVERALQEYAAAFRDLAGGWDHIFALDSVGGAYLFVAPTATAPIADAFDRPTRTLLFEDLADRLNEWLADVRTGVNERVPDAEGLFEADCVNNKNRLYKAPLSVHSSLDGVVTPLDPRDPTYHYTPLAAVDADVTAQATAWAESFTADYRDAVESVVTTLWPDYAAEADGWRGALRARAADLEAEERKQRDAREASLSPDDLERTDDLNELTAAIEAIDVRAIARKVANEYDTDPGRDPIRFDPPWRRSETGTSCFVDRDKFVDLQEGANGGGALALAARADGIISHCRESVSGTDATGRKKFWLAVNALRQLGFDVPYYTGSDGRHPDGLGLFEDPSDAEEQRRQVIRATLAGTGRTGRT